MLQTPALQEGRETISFQLLWLRCDILGTVRPLEKYSGQERLANDIHTYLKYVRTERSKGWCVRLDSLFLVVLQCSVP